MPADSKGKGFLVRGVKMWWRSRAPLTRNLGSRWKWVARFTPWPLYSRDTNPVPIE